MVTSSQLTWMLVFTPPMEACELVQSFDETALDWIEAITVEIQVGRVGMDLGGREKHMIQLQRAMSVRLNFLTQNHREDTIVPLGQPWRRRMRQISPVRSPSPSRIPVTTPSQQSKEEDQRYGERVSEEVKTEDNSMPAELGCWDSIAYDPMEWTKE